MHSAGCSSSTSLLLLLLFIELRILALPPNKGAIERKRGRNSMKRREFIKVCACVRKRNRERVRGCEKERRGQK